MTLDKITVQQALEKNSAELCPKCGLIAEWITTNYEKRLGCEHCNTWISETEPRRVLTTGYIYEELIATKVELDERVSNLEARVEELDDGDLDVKVADLDRRIDDLDLRVDDLEAK